MIISFINSILFERQREKETVCVCPETDSSHPLAHFLNAGNAGLDQAGLKEVTGYSIQISYRVAGMQLLECSTLPPRILE